MGRTKQTTEPSTGHDDHHHHHDKRSTTSASKSLKTTMASKKPALASGSGVDTAAAPNARERIHRGLQPVIEDVVQAKQAKKKPAAPPAEPMETDEPKSKARKKAHFDDETVSASFLKMAKQEERLAAHGKRVIALAPVARAMKSQLLGLRGGNRYYGRGFKVKTTPPRCYEHAVRSAQRLVEAFVVRLYSGAYSALRSFAVSGKERTKRGSILKKPITLQRGHVISYMKTQPRLMMEFNDFLHGYLKRHPEIPIRLEVL